MHAKGRYPTKSRYVTVEGKIPDSGFNLAGTELPAVFNRASNMLKVGKNGEATPLTVLPPFLSSRSRFWKASPRVLVP